MTHWRSVVISHRSGNPIHYSRAAISATRRDGGGGGSGQKDGNGGGKNGGWHHCHGGSSKKGGGSNQSRGDSGDHKGCKDGKGGGWQEMDRQMPGTSSAAAIPTATQSTAPVAPHSRFPPIAAGFIGALLSFVVVSAIIWGAYFLVRRRRANRAKAMLPLADTFVSERTPVPLAMGYQPSSTAASPMTFSAGRRNAQAPEKGADDFNPFIHPQDPRVVDPFAEPYQWKPSKSHPSHTLSA